MPEPDPLADQVSPCCPFSTWRSDRPGWQNNEHCYPTIEHVKAQSCIIVQMFTNDAVMVHSMTVNTASLVGSNTP